MECDVSVKMTRQPKQRAGVLRPRACWCTSCHCCHCPFWSSRCCTCGQVVLRSHFVRELLYQEVFSLHFRTLGVQKQTCLNPCWRTVTMFRAFVSLHHTVRLLAWDMHFSLGYVRLRPISTKTNFYLAQFLPRPILPRPGST